MPGRLETPGRPAAGAHPGPASRRRSVGGGRKTRFDVCRAPMRTLLPALLATLVLLFGLPARAEHDTLTIGISQFPESFHPGIESMMAKAYVLGFARRPFTVYDADWKLACMLCVELPTIENGLARPETTPDGKPGIAVTYGIRPEARWGDGTPITPPAPQPPRRRGRPPKNRSLDQHAG